MAGGGEGVIGVSRSHDLTQRERGCLSWAARGMTYDGIAGVLDVSPRTLGQHLASARSKLGAYSTAQAIAIASRRRGGSDGEPGLERGPAVEPGEESLWGVGSRPLAPDEGARSARVRADAPLVRTSSVAARAVPTLTGTRAPPQEPPGAAGKRRRWR